MSKLSFFIFLFSNFFEAEASPCKEVLLVGRNSVEILGTDPSQNTRLKIKIDLFDRFYDHSSNLVEKLREFITRDLHLISADKNKSNIVVLSRKRILILNPYGRLRASIPLEENFGFHEIKLVGDGSHALLTVPTDYLNQRTPRVLSLKTNRILPRPYGYSNDFNHWVKLSPNGRYLMGSRSDMTRVWDTYTGDILQDIHHHSGTHKRFIGSDFNENSTGIQLQFATDNEVLIENFSVQSGQQIPSQLD